MAAAPPWRIRALSYGLASFLVTLSASLGLYGWAT